MTCCDARGVSNDFLAIPHSAPNQHLCQSFISVRDVMQGAGRVYAGLASHRERVPVADKNVNKSRTSPISRSGSGTMRNLISQSCDSIPLLASDDNQGMRSMKFEKERFPGFQGEEQRLRARLPEVDFVNPRLA